MDILLTTESTARFRKPENQTSTDNFVNTNISACLLCSFLYFSTAYRKENLNPCGLTSFNVLRRISAKVL